MVSQIFEYDKHIQRFPKYCKTEVDNHVEKNRSPRGSKESRHSMLGSTDKGRQRGAAES